MVFKQFEKHLNGSCNTEHTSTDFLVSPQENVRSYHEREREREREEVKTYRKLKCVKVTLFLIREHVGSWKKIQESKISCVHVLTLIVS